jgi:hypothetical protein
MAVCEYTKTNFPRHTSIMFREMQASYFLKCCKTILGSPRRFFHYTSLKLAYSKHMGRSFPISGCDGAPLNCIMSPSCLITKSLRVAKFGCFHSDLSIALQQGKCPMSHPKLCLNLCHREIKRIQIISVFYILTFLLPLLSSET